MNWFQTLFQLFYGDFKERIRRYSFLMTMMGSLFWGYLVITRKYSIQFGHYQGEFNSAWAGTVMAVCCTMMLAIFGFYLVKNSVKRDRITKVGQILASSPTTNFTYILSKFLSNFSVLCFIIALLMVMALVMQLLDNNQFDVNLWDLFSPFVIITVPAMMLVSGLAVLFESIRFLNGSLGNILYLFTMQPLILATLWKSNMFDLTCLGVFEKSVGAAANKVYSGVELGMQMGFIGFVENELQDPTKIFYWGGIDWTTHLILYRFIWVAFAIVAIFLAVPFFNRFDPAKDKKRKLRPTKAKKLSVETKKLEHKPVLVDFNIKLSTESTFSLFQMVKAELRVMLKGFHLFWYTVALGLIVAQILVPIDIARQYVVAAAMIWPLVIWSGMGTREAMFGTGQLLFSSPSPLKRQLPAIWMAGIMVGFLAVSGMIFKTLIMGDFSYLAALIVGVLFVPSLALALGLVSGTKKLFEVIYLIVWYVGSIDQIVPLDFLATTDISISQGIFYIFFLLTLGLIFISIISRYRQTTYR